MPSDYWFICLDCKQAVLRYRNLRKCPSCGSSEIIRVIESPVRDYKGMPVVVRSGDTVVTDDDGEV